MISPRRSIAAALIAVAALAGCSSSHEPAGPLAAAAATVAPTPSPASAAPTKAQAAKIYLGAITPANKALTKLDAALKSRNLKRIRATAKACAKANRAVLVMLTSTQWPKGVQKHADKLSESVAVDLSAFTALAKAKTPSEVNEASAGLSTDNSQAQLMRVKLGLGPAI